MFIRFLDYFFLLRPILFFPGWTTALTGWIIAMRLHRQTPAPVPISDSFWLSLASFTCLMGAAFIVNQLQDARSDSLNDKLFFISRRLISPRAAWLEVGVFLVAGLVLASIASVALLVIYLVSSVLFVVLYNFHPFSMKDRVAGSVIANAAMGLSALAFGWWSARTDFLEFAIAGSPYVAFNTGIYFLTTIPDASGDNASNKHTVSVRYGKDSAISMALLCIVAAGILSWITRDNLMGWVLICSSPFLLAMVWRRRIPDVLRATKSALFVFAIIVGVYFPLYYAMIIFFFVMTRWYYRKRFGLNYPSFRA